MTEPIFMDPPPVRPGSRGTPNPALEQARANPGRWLVYMTRPGTKHGAASCRQAVYNLRHKYGAEFTVVARLVEEGIGDIVPAYATFIRKEEQ